MSNCDNCNLQEVCKFKDKSIALEKEVEGMHIDDILVLTVKCKHKETTLARNPLGGTATIYYPKKSPFDSITTIL